jgi:hypothetical protein
VNLQLFRYRPFVFECRNKLAQGKVALKRLKILELKKAPLKNVAKAGF